MDHDADPVLQDDEGRDAMDHTPFDAEYVKGMIRNKSGRSNTSILFMRNNHVFANIRSDISRIFVQNWFLKCFG